jgi:hypothetical protein
VEPIEPRRGLSWPALLALLGVSLALVGIAAWPRVQALLDRTSPPRIAARAIALSLRERAETVGPVEISGAELRLLDGKLRLVVSKPDDADSGAVMSHFHVLATAADVPSAALDACIMGMGDSPEKRLQDVVQGFVGVAFPAVFSRIKGQPLLGAHPFRGDEPWGVPGMRGYAGTVLARGSVHPRAFMDAPLFSDIPNLPRDGKLHIIKAVLYPKGGFWLRTLELDGQKTGISERRFAPVDPQGESGMIVRYAVYDRASTPAAAGGREHAVERLKAREAWLFAAEECPADLIPAALPAFSFSSTACRGDRLHECLLECEHGSAFFCHMAAQEVLSTDLDPAAAQALFLRSCRLGYASGCTNAAAGRLQGGLDDCSLRTFEQICERSGDPWACTMWGSALAQGEVTARNPVRARTALARACRASNEEDPACQAAKGILSSLEAPPTPTD